MQETPMIMETLKSATFELHEEAEHHPYQRAFVKGELSLRAYIEYLAQMRWVHRAVEAPLWERRSQPMFQSVVRPHHFRVAMLDEDLRNLDADQTAFEPFSATRKLTSMIDDAVEESPISLLGYLYVLEGSTNGTKFIARSVERALRLDAGRGTAYMNPHGEFQKERWGQFKESMNSLFIGSDESRAILEAARTMFLGVIHLSNALQSARSEALIPSGPTSAIRPRDAVGVTTS